MDKLIITVALTGNIPTKEMNLRGIEYGIYLKKETKQLTTMDSSLIYKFPIQQSEPKEVNAD